MPGDLPDYTKYISQNVEIPASEQGPVIPRPKGGVQLIDSATTTAAYATVVEYVVTDGKVFQPAKLAVACSEDVWVKIRWDGSDISIEYLIPGGTPFTDWFPWDWVLILGDGAAKLEIQAKYDSAAATVYVELDGEEVSE